MLLKYVENLLVKIRERQTVVAERLTSGAFKEFCEYKETVGFLNGLKESEELAMKAYASLVETKKLDNGENKGDYDVSKVKFY